MCDIGEIRDLLHTPFTFPGPPFLGVSCAAVLDDPDCKVGRFDRPYQRVVNEEETRVKEETARRLQDPSGSLRRFYSHSRSGTPQLS
jgi:hypothetical protein